MKNTLSLVSNKNNKMKKKNKTINGERLKKLLRSLKPYWNKLTKTDITFIQSLQLRTKNGKYTPTNKQIDNIKSMCNKYIGVVIDGVRYIDNPKVKHQVIIPKRMRRDNGIARQIGL